MIFAEIKAYGYDNPRKKLIAGIVLTGGGSELKHIKQLVEYITGIDTRIGVPSEHVAGESAGLVARPLYATAVGLTMESDLNNSRSQIYVQEHQGETKQHESSTVSAVSDEKQQVETSVQTDEEDIETEDNQLSSAERIKQKFFGGFLTRFKEFIDKSE